MDYFSRYLEVVQVTTTTSFAVVNVMKNIFSRHGIPEILRSDNGLYSSSEFEEFAKKYGFKHVTSSPRYPRSNGLAERMVQTAKRLIKKAADVHIALLNYRSTPLPWCNLSPAQLLMGRNLRSTVPQTSVHLVPQWDYLEEFREQEHEYKRKQQRGYNQRYRTSKLPVIPEDTPVWV